MGLHKLRKMKISYLDDLNSQLFKIENILSCTYTSEFIENFFIIILSGKEDLNNLNERFDKLDKHFELAQKDLELAKISQKKVHSRGSKIISIDVEDKSDNKKIIN